MALDPVTAAFDIGGKLIDKLWPDPAQRDAAKVELLRMKQAGDLAALTAETDLMKGQLAINQAEAQSQSLFVAGWRPFIGWVCGLAFAYHFVAQPLIAFLLSISGRPIALPAFDMSTLSTVLMGMLGLGGLRSFEKVRGINKK